VSVTSFCFWTRAGEVQRPVGLGDLEQVRLRLADELVAGDLAVDLRDSDDRAVVLDAGALQQRLGDRQRQARGRLRVRHEVDRVVSGPRDLLGERHVGAGAEPLPQAGLDRRLVLAEAVGAARPQRAAHGLVGVLVLRLGEQVGVELAAGLADARVPDQRHVAEDPDLRRMRQRAGEEVFQAVRGGLGVGEQLVSDALGPPGREAGGDLGGLAHRGQVLLRGGEYRGLLLEVGGQSLLRGPTEGLIPLVEVRPARRQEHPRQAQQRHEQSPASCR
jgi:hypothetical protein